LVSLSGYEIEFIFVNNINILKYLKIQKLKFHSKSYHYEN
jgi:hypothetical protein